ncbi:MAG: flagellar filament capping protein FliD [Candidatus Hydrogenedentota bacterium]
MSGGFSAGGLISGLDSNTLIQQLMQIERQPILRYQDRIEQLETQQTATRGLRTTLSNLRNTMQDFRLNDAFDQFSAASSEESVLTAEISGSNPVTGSFSLDVTRLASATTAASSAVIGGPIDNTATLDNSGIAADITTGTFSINGVAFNVDPTTDSLDDVMAQINASSAGVTATYDGTADTVTIANSTAGDTSIINFGATGDDSNFLDVLRVTQATQETNGDGSTEVTSTRNLGSVDATTTLDQANFANGAVTAGAFSINGINISVDPTQDSLQDITARISNSDAGVSASYDGTSDTIRLTSATPGSRTINFGAAGDTSNFLAIANLDTAVQDAGNDAEFSVNGGAAQTRNSNSIDDVIDGVTINLQSTGTSAVTVAVDSDTIVEDVRGFIEDFNTSISELRELTGEEGTLSGDLTLRQIDNFLLGNVFNNVEGVSGDLNTLLAIGISTGNDFSASSTPTLEMDEDAFRTALNDDRQTVSRLFSNEDGSGIADKFFKYLDDVAGFSGFLNARAKSNGTIDRQIRAVEDQIESLEQRLVHKEDRLRKSFLRLEELSAGFQNQASALGQLGGGIAGF